MRGALLLLLAGCGFKGASFGIDADVAGTDTKLATDDAPATDAPSTMLVDAPPPVDAMVDAAQMIDASTSAKVCPAGGQKIDANTFYFSTDQHRYSSAEAACEALSKTNNLPVHLATPRNQGEAKKIADMQTADYEWIGVFQPLLSLGKDKGWTFITGGAAYIDFEGQEPNDGNSIAENGTENFAQMYGGGSGNPHGSMNDTSGNDNLYYICECDGLAADGGTLLTVPPNLP